MMCEWYWISMRYWSILQAQEKSNMVLKQDSWKKKKLNKNVSSWLKTPDWTKRVLQWQDGHRIIFPSFSCSFVTWYLKWIQNRLFTSGNQDGRSNSFHKGYKNLKFCFFVGKTQTHFFAYLSILCGIKSDIFVPAGLWLHSVSAQLLLFLLAHLSTSYSLIKDPDPDIQAINWLPASLPWSSAWKPPGDAGTHRRSAFLAKQLFPPVCGESQLVFWMFSALFQLWFCFVYPLAGSAKQTGLYSMKTLKKQEWPINQSQSPESAVLESDGTKTSGGGRKLLTKTRR